MYRGYVEVEKEISKEMYDYLNKKGHEEIERYACEQQMLSGFPPAGYGNYGSKIYENDGKYYLFYKRDSSCD